MWVKIFTAICADQIETHYQISHSFSKLILYLKTPPSHYEKDGIVRPKLDTSGAISPPHPGSGRIPYSPGTGDGQVPGVCPGEDVKFQFDRRFRFAR